MFKIFAHRGYLIQNNLPNILQENSLASLKNAVANNFSAIEFDIWFVNNQLVLSHNYPSNKQKNNLFNDFLLYKNQLEYWLDFKNIDLQNVDKILNLVKKDLAQAQIDLTKVYFVPYVVDYDLAQKIFERFKVFFGKEVMFGAVCDQIKQINDLKNFVEKNNLKLISIDHKLISDEVIRNFKNCQLMAWTVNNQDQMKALIAKGIKIFASDTVKPF